MRHYKIILALFVLSLFFKIGFSQSDTLVFYPVNNPALKDYSLRKMCVDKTGKLWFATDKGIVSYDGNDVKVFDHKEGDSTSLAINSTGRLFLDDSDNLYIWAVGGQIFFNTKTGKATPLDIRFRDEDKSTLAFPYPLSEPLIDDDGSIWSGIPGVGFIHYSRKTKKTSYFTSRDNPSFKATSVYVIRRSIPDKNILWLATDDGIYSFNKTTKQIKRNFRSSNPGDSTGFDPVILNLDVCRDTIWFTSAQRGVGCYDIASGHYTLFPNRNSAGEPTDIDISFFQRKDNDEYYISSGENLPGIFNVRTHTYSFPTKTFQNLPSVQLRHFVADNNNNLWGLIFYQLYLARPSTDKLNTFTLPPVTGNPRQIVKNVAWDQKTRYYYVVMEQGSDVIVLDSNARLVKSIPVEPVTGVNESQVIFDIGTDDAGGIWLCGTSLWMYDQGSQKFILARKFNPGLNFKSKWFQNLLIRGNYIYLQPSYPDCRAIYRVDRNRLSCDSILLPREIIPDTSGTNGLHIGRTQRFARRMDVLQIDKAGRFAYFCYDSTIFQLDLGTLKAKKIVSVTETEKPYEHFYNMFWYRLDDMDDLWVVTSSDIKVYEPKNFKVIKTIPLEKDSYALQFFNIEGQGIMCYLNSNGLSLLDYKNNNQFNLKLSDGLLTTFNSTVACINRMLFIGSIGYFHYISLESVIKTNLERRCYLTNIRVFNQPYKTDSLPEFLRTLNLEHDQNFVTLTFSSTEFDQPERLEYRYKMDGVDGEWIYVNYLNRTISYNDLQPGSYTFHAEAKNTDGKWGPGAVSLVINVIPAWWQTVLFKIAAVAIVCVLVFAVVRWRINIIRKEEREKARQHQERSKIEKEMLGLEARALRAQMNPHFIFNCMNSIKSLIQQNEQDKAVAYLTTFSKLIRTIFQNSDKREISLFDEIETCRLYTQLESMRFNNKFSYEFYIDETLDLKSVMVPALIVQPFIENAIWHGIMPKEDGGRLTVKLGKTDHSITCIIDDDGIGIDTSKQNKFKGASSMHESKGVHLTQARLDLDNLLTERKAGINIIDKKDANTRSSGTTVILSFEEY